MSAAPERTWTEETANVSERKWTELYVADAIARAVAEETERCAKIADDNDSPGLIAHRIRWPSPAPKPETDALRTIMREPLTEARVREIVQEKFDCSWWQCSLCGRTGYGDLDHTCAQTMYDGAIDARLSVAERNHSALHTVVQEHEERLAALEARTYTDAGRSSTTAAPGNASDSELCRSSRPLGSSDAPASVPPAALPTREEIVNVLRSHEDFDTDADYVLSLLRERDAQRPAMAIEEAAKELIQLSRASVEQARPNEWHAILRKHFRAAPEAVTVTAEDVRAAYNVAFTTADPANVCAESDAKFAAALTQRLARRDR